MNDDSSAGVRADVWLWAARFFKTRSQCRKAIDGGKVDLNDASCKSSRAVRPGDHLRITRGEDRIEIDVLAVSESRGPASVAQTLYRETDASRTEREARRERLRLMGPVGPLRRPDKQERRALRRLKEKP